MARRRAPAGARPCAASGRARPPATTPPARPAAPAPVAIASSTLGARSTSVSPKLILRRCLNIARISGGLQTGQVKSENVSQLGGTTAHDPGVLTQEAGW